MTGPIFDTHAHYSARAFDADRFALLDSLPAKGVVGVCEQATHSGDAPRVLELAHRYPWVVAAIGIHPESLLPAADCGEEGPAPTVSVYGGDWAAEMQALMPYYDDPKVVAVGECGLDYHWPEPKPALQKQWFRRQIELAKEVKLPIIVHSRDAAEPTMQIIQETKAYECGGVIHCYSYSPEMAEEYVKMGFFIGMGGVLTFKNAKKLVRCAERIPLSSIVLETDCPYMAPEPNRGKRNYSGYLPYVAEEIAALKGAAAEDVVLQTEENARKLYGL